MTTELYKKYRPVDLDRIVGNASTVKALRSMLDRKQVPHSILFSGPSGCGKTTLARLLAAALECGDMDLSELDASQFRGIETIRDVQHVVNLMPVGGKCRVWILDECHQLTKDAQTACLKLIEDTPEHAYFFWCTTTPEKLLPTVVNRCTSLPVEQLKSDEVEYLVRRVAKKESLDVSSRGVEAIVEHSGGSARKALVILDKVGRLPRDEQAAAAAIPSEDEKATIDLCRALIKKAPWVDIAKILKALKAEPEEVRHGVLGYARAVLLGSNGKDVRPFTVICAFEQPFYNGGPAALARACYEAVFGGGA